MSSSTSNTIINPKDCSYQCGVRIYWNTLEYFYLWLFIVHSFSAIPVDIFLSAVG